VIGYLTKVKEAYVKLDKNFGNHEDNCDCQNFVAIIQKYVDLYQRCSEYRFMVLWGKIIGVSYHTYKVFDKKIVTLNNRIYEFIHEIIDVLQKKYGDDYFFARIDIVTECNDTRDNKHTSTTIFDKDFKGKIYLNEIEPLGSGAKTSAYPLFDDSKKCTGLVIKNEHHIYDTIQTSLIRLVNNIDPTPRIIFMAINYNLFDKKVSTLLPFTTISSDGNIFIEDMLNYLQTKYSYNFELWYNRSGKRIKLEPKMAVEELWLQMIKYPHDLYGFTHN